MNSTQKHETEAEQGERIELEREQLKQWVLANCDEESTARLRLEEGFDSWVAAAAEEYVNWTAKRLSNGSTAADNIGNRRSVEPKKSPTAEEIKALRRFREKVGTVGTVQLVHAVYGNGKRTELELTLRVPVCGEMKRYFLLPSTVKGQQE